MSKYILLFLLFPLSSFGQFKINEASNSNGNTILLPNGDSPDWIEIYNASSSSANISGYGLSDDPSNLMKWVFPTTSIGALNFLTVFATGNNAINLVNHYETGVFAESTWKYKIPTEEIPDWKSNSFNSSSWLTGAASIGFGDGDDATVLNAPITTIYSLITFQCTNITAISEALLDIDYDDGFVA
ncbi:MAG: lamin tail domain-containing protein, partial [Flavobacteriia bacterium]|nr:lamin tail domain-containing protein [Flavobacteriia bacterium]